MCRLSAGSRLCLEKPAAMAGLCSAWVFSATKPATPGWCLRPATVALAAQLAATMLVPPCAAQRLAKPQLGRGPLGPGLPQPAPSRCRQQLGVLFQDRQGEDAPWHLH